jgi:hypothetical protein
MATLFLSGFVHPDKRRGASVWLCRACARGALVWFQSSPFCGFTVGSMVHTFVDNYKLWADVGGILSVTLAAGCTNFSD